MKKFKFLQMLFCVVLGGTMMFSCVLEEVDDTRHDTGITVISGSNEQEVDFNIAYEIPQGHKVVFDVYAENPFEITSEGFGRKNSLKPILSAMTNESGEYNISRVISGGVKEVYVVSRSAGAAALLYGTIQDGSVAPKEIELPSLIESQANVDSRATSWNIPYLGGWNYWGRPDYIDGTKKCDITSLEMRTISKVLPEWRKVKEEYTTADFVKVEKTAEIWISLLSDKSLFNNALGYYCYTEGMTKEDIPEVIALPRTNISWFKSTGLKSGEYVKLKYLNPETKKFEDKFPAGVKIGWVLHRSGFHCLTSKVSNGTYQFYSNNEWNPEKRNKNHTAMFTTSQGNIIVGFEDTYNEALLVDNDCNDIVFHVASYPKDAISSKIVVPDASEDVVEEEVDVIQPLTDIVEISESDILLKDIMVASKSNLVVEDGNVVGVRDVLYLADTKTMNELVTRTYSSSEMERKVVVRTTVKFARAAEEQKERTVVRTTVKNTTWDVEEKVSRALFNYVGNDVSGLILAAANHYRARLAEGICIKLEVVMEFEPVEYNQFIESINVPPYSPFIKDIND
jgi:hypothetical protein